MAWHKVRYFHLFFGNIFSAKEKLFLFFLVGTSGQTGTERAKSC